MKNLNKLAALIVAATTIISPVAFAADGDTTLGAEACTDVKEVRVYDIDFGSFTATDVLGVSVDDRAGAKNGAGQSGATESTPTAPTTNQDFYVEIDNPCYDTNGGLGWYVDVMVGDMIDQDTVIAGTTGTPIAANNHRLDSDGTLYRFQDSPANAAVTAAAARADATYADADDVDLITHDGTENGIAGYYGVLLTHEMDIPADQSVDEYKGTITVTLVE